MKFRYVGDPAGSFLPYKEEWKLYTDLGRDYMLFKYVGGDPSKDWMPYGTVKDCRIETFRFEKKERDGVMISWIAEIVDDEAVWECMTYRSLKELFKNWEEVDET